MHYVVNTRPRAVGNDVLRAARDVIAWPLVCLLCSSAVPVVWGVLRVTLGRWSEIDRAHCHAEASSRTKQCGRYTYT